MPKRRIKTKQISLRLTPDQMRELDKWCEATQMTRADFIGVLLGVLGEDASLRGAVEGILKQLTNSLQPTNLNPTLADRGGPSQP